jgi:hypothetical protein
MECPATVQSYLRLYPAIGETLKLNSFFGIGRIGGEAAGGSAKGECGLSTGHHELILPKILSKQSRPLEWRMDGARFSVERTDRFESADIGTQPARRELTHRNAPETTFARVEGQAVDSLYMPIAAW